MTTAVAPYSAEEEQWPVMSDEALLSQHGIVQSAFGYQASEPVFELLKPHLNFPYFRVLELDR